MIRNDLNEPYEVWLRRRQQERLHLQAELRIRRPFLLPQIAGDLMHIVATSPKDELTRFEIVNAYSKQRRARGRVARKECRLEALACISGLIRMKLLEWGRRNYVRIADPNRHLQWIEDQKAATRNLPKPVLNL